MKAYRLVHLRANAAGVYRPLKGWRVFQFCEPNWNDEKHPVWAWIVREEAESDVRLPRDP